MITLQGIGIVGGINIGKTSIFKRSTVNIFKKSEDPSQEIIRFHKAHREALSDAKMLYERTLHDIGEEEAAIFEAQEMILLDEEFIKHAEFLILEEKMTAIYAVLETGEYYADIFLSMQEDIMKTKAMDMRNVASLLVRHLSNYNKEDRISSPCIILAENLMPSDLIEIGRDNIQGIVLKHGSTDSHVSILAASMNVPYIVCQDINLSQEWDDKLIAIDAYTGAIYLLPNASTQKDLTNKKNHLQEKMDFQLKQTQECTTFDGKRIYVNANIGDLKDLDIAIKNGCDGIGLFRSEFQYIGRSNFPSENELFEDYRYAAETMKGKRVVIRTLDIGSDKKVKYIKFPQESNPALGYRGIRVCLENLDIFKTQLRAIYRASHYGNIAVMFPMISSIEEIRSIKTIIDVVKLELTSENIPYENIEVGIMIETPAAAIMSDEFAKETDFFSAGTNDLCQYTLAIDRDNLSISSSFRHHHPAVLRMLEMTAKNAHSQNIRMCICGELGRDTESTQILIDMGINEFSVAPIFIPTLKNNISHCKGL